MPKRGPEQMPSTGHSKSYSMSHSVSHSISRSKHLALSHPIPTQTIQTHPTGMDTQKEKIRLKGNNSSPQSEVVASAQARGREPEHPPTGRRYDVATMIRAKQLRDAGWTLAEIARLIEREQGVRVSTNTVLRWTSPAYARKQDERHRTNRRRYRYANISGRMPATGNLSADFKLIRAQALHAKGLSVRAIATVMSFDFPATPVTYEQIRHAFETDRWPGTGEPAIRDAAV